MSTVLIKLLINFLSLNNTILQKFSHVTALTFLLNVFCEVEKKFYFLKIIELFKF